MKRSNQTLQQKIFQADCQKFGLPIPIPEYKFHPERKWRIDFYFEAGCKRVALEVEGGAWTSGRHTRGSGYVKDVEKYNALTLAGIYLLRTFPSELHKKETMAMVLEALKNN